MKNLSINARIILGFTIVILLIGIIVLPVVLNLFEDVIVQAEERELHKLGTSAQAELASEGRLAEAMSALVAHSKDFSKAFASGNRVYLAEQLVPAFKYLKKNYAVRQFQFHTPPANSFFRVHKPEKFGDDLSSFRKTIVATNTSKTPVRGLERGVAGLGIRGISPIFVDDRHVGSVEFGMSFGQAFFEQFKAKYHVDIGLYLKSDTEYKVFGSTRPGDPLLKTDSMNMVMNSDAVIDRIEVNGTPYAVYGKKIVDFNNNPVGLIEIVLDRTQYVDALASSRNTILLVMALAIILGIGIAFLISRSITRPICNTVAAMNDIALGEGDLTRRLDTEGKNEIAMLGAAFNQFAEKVQRMVQQISTSISQLNSAVANMSVITGETTQGIQQQRTETDLVATAIQEMSATVQEVNRNAAQAANAAHHADEEARQGKQIVAQTIDAMDKLANEVENASVVIQTLKADSADIGGVLDVIRGIAEQTNLLALNAAIEAARAGEQGRGFAVVADEVRTLASRTQQSTQEIQVMIEKLQNGANNAVHVMESGRTQAQSGVEQAAHAGSSLDAITNAVATISDMNTQIASAAEQQSAVAEEINRNITNISQVADTTASGSQQTANASVELAKLADELQSLASQFKV